MKGNSTTYLIIPFLKGLELLPKGILCLAAGGCMPKEKRIRFVIVGCDDDHLLSEDVKRYTDVRNQIGDTGKWPRMPEFLSPLFLNGTDIGDNYFFEVYSSKQRQWLYFSAFSKFDYSELGDDDRFVVVSSTEDVCTLSLHDALVAQPWMERFRKSVQNVCVVVYEEGCETHRKANAFRAYRWLNGSTTVFTGIREDAYRKGMTLMETIATVVNANYGLLSGIPSHQESITYTPDDLPSQYVRESIIRMKMLYDIREVTSSGKYDLEKWRKGFDIGSKNGPWKSGMPFNAVNDLLDMFKEFIQKIPSDHFTFPKEDASTISSRLNKMSSPMLKGLTQHDKRIIQMEPLLELASSISSSAISVPGYIESPHIEAINEVFTMALVSGTPSPTAPWGIMSLAFSKKCLGLQEAARLRSACLDLWELFYRHPKSEISKVVEVVEYNLETINKDIKHVLEQTDKGKKLMQERWLFKIRGKDFLAWSSSFTGFALNRLPLSTLSIGGFNYFSTIRELGQRDTDIQDFIFKYVNSVDGFGEDFKLYVNEQIPLSLRNKAQSQGKNLYKLYPRFRYHIGVEALKK